MREIVVVQVGNCGNVIGSKFWELISDEHGIEPDGVWRGNTRLQLERIEVYYAEGRKKRYFPRCACLDIDQAITSAVQSGPYGRLIDSNNIVTKGDGTGNNWARGYYTDGLELVQPSLDLIRRHCESTDCLQGFQLSQSLGGGTGSGFGSLILQKLSEEYPDRIINTYSVIPSIMVSTVVVEPYNCVLGLNVLMETASEAICMDNEAMNDICTKTLKISFPTIRDVNHLICSVMTGVTACFRCLRLQENIDCINMCAEINE
ncbi:unnamed protein product [Nezara viridula]|uniref:Tubulin beta chain n=1 Tax=Nezara viridula TaxID=85310 RepID=A0A9P0HA33_NEZVI|nr:unnamed protein product [Nezara viridula]